MTPERWKQIYELVEAALDRGGEERVAFLDEACAGDDELRREVESLISYQQQASKFLEDPAFKHAADLFSDPQTEIESMEGQTISHYSILRKLGAGGMGEVYLALDTALDRKVAIKFLSQNSVNSEQARKRLVREARAAAALDHPHICAVHEVGEESAYSFIVMQYVEGETLAERMKRERLSIRNALDIAVQMADALTEAHSRGIIHRDIKPRNIMITPRGQVKVLDFGLAKTIQENRRTDSGDETQSVLTEPGVIVGTVPYMSPEQVKGEIIDARSDVFSLGAVIYEMVTGRQPFACVNTVATISAILTREPPMLADCIPDVPNELERIMRMCLVKDPSRRYQSSETLFQDLARLERGLDSRTILSENVPDRSRRTSRPRNKAIDSLAVLPMVNSGDDPDAEYLSDGITESIINNISQLPKLRLIALSAVISYKGRTFNPRDVGRELGVRAVLTGRMRLLGDTVSIRAELVNVADGSLLWGEQYTHKIADIFALQETISREISEKLRLRLTEKEKKQLKKRSTQNLEAYKSYLKGRYYWNQRTEEWVKKSIEQFQEAIGLDPDYGPPYAGLADCYALMGEGSGVLPREAFRKAKALAIKALEIDETIAEAHASLAHIMQNYDWDWSGAEIEYQRAIELNPSYATAHQWYGWYLIDVGRFDEAITQMRWAQQIDPISRAIDLSLGMINYYWRHQYDQAIVQLRKMLKFDPNFPSAHFWLGWVYERNAMYKEALEEFQQVVVLPNSKDDPDIVAALGFTYATSGNRSEAQKLLEELNRQSQQSHVPPFDIGLIHMGLGEKDNAFVWFEKAYEDRSHWLTGLKVNPIFDSLRSDPRFDDLLNRVGLPQ
jgi:serine/threonine-protein kinase